jgi:TonB family protein
MNKFFIILIFGFILNTPNFSQTPDNLPVGLVPIEEFPRFNNGNITRFELWIYSNLHYPEEAILNSVSGIVIVRFYIDSLGVPGNASIIKGDNSELNEEVLRVVSTSPKWIPGKLFDKPKGVFLSFGIEFSLKDIYFEKKIKKLSRLDKRYNK